ncbi:uncharacterized protein [Montipora capricornis]|uniref:uncharacterized protein n=1 Tax=Montipora capricornis TaxID=246305 RepID=UPI0035F13234
MKSWKLLFIAGAFLLMTSIVLTTAFPKHKNVKPLLKQRDDEQDVEETDEEATKKPKIKVQCAKSLDVIKKVATSCSESNCPGGAKACRGHYENYDKKFCVCSHHSIFLKTERQCIDMEKPCDHARLLRLCHSKATCMPAGKGLYYCKCPKGYTLNGETCQKIKKKAPVKIEQKKVKVEESSGSNIGIIIPAVVVPLVVIIAVVVICVLKKGSQSGDEEEDEADDGDNEEDY